MDLKVEWWAYIVMVVAVFTFCVFLHYLVKRYNEVRLEERFIRLYGKSSASTQVQDTFLSGEGKETSKFRRESRKSNPEGISMIFSKEANRNKASHINDWIPGLSSLSFFRNKGIKLHPTDSMPKKSDVVVVDQKLRSADSKFLNNSLSKDMREEVEIKSQFSDQNAVGEDDGDNRSTYNSFLGAIYKNLTKTDKGEVAGNNVIITDTKTPTAGNSRQIIAYDLLNEITGTVLDTVIDGKPNNKTKKPNSKLTNANRSKHSVKNDAISERFIDIDSQNNVPHDVLHKSESKEVTNVKLEYLDEVNKGSSRTSRSDINFRDTRIDSSEDYGSSCRDLQKKIEELNRGIMHNLNSLQVVNVNLKEVVKMRQTARSFALIPSEIATLKFINELVYGLINNLQLKDKETIKNTSSSSKVTFVDEMINELSYPESNGIEFAREKPSRITICERVPSAIRLKPNPNDGTNLKKCASKVTFKDDVSSILTDSTLTFNDDNIKDTAETAQNENS